MHRFLLIVFICTAATGTLAQTRSAKRGIAYGQHSATDLKALSKGVSWWYNWHHVPESAVLDTYQQNDVDFVPMAWGSTFNKEAMRTYLQTHPEVKYLLGWNESNFKEQANLTPTEAAAHWPDLEELAAEFNLKIVGPAVNFCDVCVTENGTTYTDPIEYLDAFFAACPDCQVDYIAIHSYMGEVSALQWFVNEFKKYEKPIWLTEFAHWENNPTLQDEKNFMVGAVDYLENDPDIFRYAWFTGRRADPPLIGLLNNTVSGKLSSLGEIYVNMPLHDPEHYNVIPARIELENYNRMSGILLQLTEDVSGFANVGYIETNDWLEYGIDVPADGEYNLSIRVASTQAGSLSVSSDKGTLNTIIGIPNTQGWQTWTTVTVPIELEAGKQKITLRAFSAGFNLNWMDITQEVVLSQEPHTEAVHLSAHPNPTDGLVYIETTTPVKVLTITDLLGRTLYTGKDNSADLSSFSNGTYVIHATFSNGERLTQKLLKK